MKNLIITTFCLLILFASAVAQSQADSLKSETDTLVIATKIYCSHCDQCGSCKPRIENAMKAKKGIKSVSVNSKEQTVTVVYNTSKTDPAAIRNFIADTGFDADEVKATKASYDALDGCCKKH